MHDINKKFYRMLKKILQFIFIGDNTKNIINISMRVFEFYRVAAA